MTWRGLTLSVLAEFASHGVGGFSTDVRVRRGFRGVSLAPETFSAGELQREAARLAAIRPVHVERSPRERPKAPPPCPRPCANCGGDVPESRLGTVAVYCSDDCRFQAAYERGLERGACRRGGCERDVESGRTHCRPHLDEIASRERAKREAMRVERSAA